MKSTAANPSEKKGASLIEAVIAVGVLAVAVPLVFGTMAGTGETGISSQAETRSSWIVPACVDELQLAMKNQSELLGELKPGVKFPAGGVLALGFTSEGRAVEKIGSNDYSRGVRKVSLDPVRYIASMSGELPEEGREGLQQNLRVKIVMEYPASAPLAKRQKLEFYMTLP